MRAIDLDRRHVYITPQGFRCVLKAQPEERERTTWFSFVYLEREGGFCFTLANVPLLKREGRYATAAR